MYKPQRTQFEILKSMVKQWHYYRTECNFYTGKGKNDRNAERKANEAAAAELATWHLIANNFGAYTDKELESKLAAFDD